MFDSLARSRDGEFACRSAPAWISDNLCTARDQQMVCKYQALLLMIVILQVVNSQVAKATLSGVKWCKVA
jgi:hypothetical protein